MKTHSPTISRQSVWLWFISMKLILLAISASVHWLLVTSNYHYGNNAFENFGLWLLLVSKTLGANLILGGIFSEFKIRKP